MDLPWREAASHTQQDGGEKEKGGSGRKDVFRRRRRGRSLEDEARGRLLRPSLRPPRAAALPWELGEQGSPREMTFALQHFRKCGAQEPVSVLRGWGAQPAVNAEVLRLPEGTVSTVGGANSRGGQGRRHVRVQGTSVLGLGGSGPRATLRRGGPAAPHRDPISTSRSGFDLAGPCWTGRDGDDGGSRRGRRGLH